MQISQTCLKGYEGLFQIVFTRANLPACSTEAVILPTSSFPLKPLSPVISNSAVIGGLCVNGLMMKLFIVWYQRPTHR